MKNRSFFISVFLMLCVNPLFSDQNWKQVLMKNAENKQIPSWAKEQIKRDFSAIDPSCFSPENREGLHSQELWLGDPNLVDITIVNNKVMVEPHGNAAHSERLHSIRNVFENLVSITPLPDVALTVSLSDDLHWYLHSIDQPLPFPVLVFAKHIESREQILIPDWEIFQGYTGFHREAVNGSRDFPWEKKVEKAIWRGTTTGADYSVENYRDQWRTQLVSQSFAHPDFIDARFNFICQNDQDLHKEMAKYVGKHMSIYHQLQYKYQILIDGNTAAFSRAYWQLWSNSVIFKQDSPFIQWYSRALNPNVHYFPFARDSSDLVKKIAFAKRNDQKAKQVANNASNFARNNLKPEDIYLYLYFVICEFAKMQNLLRP